MRIRAWFPILLLIPLLAAWCVAPATASPSGDDWLAGDARVFLVRHAEKAEGEDPGLNAQGYQRAVRLGHCLARHGLMAVYATETQRARQTANAIATRVGLRLRIYDPARLDELAAGIRAGIGEGEGPVVVVGHSNTTGQLAAHLGGDPGPEWDEADYDRLYVIDLASGQSRILAQSQACPEP